MNASDYGYATSASHSTNLSSHNNTIHTLNNWLFSSQGNEWTNTPSPAENYYAIYVSFYGNLTLNSVTCTFAVRPIVYLVSNIYVSSEDGSQVNPYILVK